MVSAVLSVETPTGFIHQHNKGPVPVGQEVVHVVTKFLYSLALHTAHDNCVHERTENGRDVFRFQPEASKSFFALIRTDTGIGLDVRAGIGLSWLPSLPVSKIVRKDSTTLRIVIADMRFGSHDVKGFMLDIPCREDVLDALPASRPIKIGVFKIYEGIDVASGPRVPFENHIEENG